jgi:hypothetical protein
MHLTHHASIYTQAEMVFGYYHCYPKALTLSQRADRVPHLLLDTGREIFSFQRSSVGMPDLTLCVRDVTSQSVITKCWISSSYSENTLTRRRASPLHSTTEWWNEDMATSPCPVPRCGSRSAPWERVRVRDL